MAAFARRAASLGYTIENIDVGGGFASRNTLHQQYAPGEEANPSFDSYAEAISGALIKADFATESPPTLVLETGRALVDEAGTLLTTVIGNGRLPSGQRSTVVDAGVNLLFTSFWYKHKVQPTREFHGRLEETVLYGPLCMNIDCLRPSVHLPVMQTGESLAISPVGAYNVTQWMQFIRMRPAVVLIGREGEVCRIREAETINALKDHEHLPEWLR
jgi:diaminopimelate decarboxylase